MVSMICISRHTERMLVGLFARFIARFISRFCSKSLTGDNDVTKAYIFAVLLLSVVMPRQHAHVKGLTCFDGKGRRKVNMFDGTVRQVTFLIDGHHVCEGIAETGINMIAHRGCSVCSDIHGYAGDTYVHRFGSVDGKIDITAGILIYLTGRPRGTAAAVSGVMETCEDDTCLIAFCEIILAIIHTSHVTHCERGTDWTFYDGSRYRTGIDSPCSTNLCTAVQRDSRCADRDSNHMFAGGRIDGVELFSTGAVVSTHIHLLEHRTAAVGSIGRGRIVDFIKRNLQVRCSG